MFKLIQKIVVLSFALLLLFPATNGLAATTWSKGPSEPVDTLKNWNITFSDIVSANSVNANSVYVLDATGNKVNTSILIEGKVVKVIAPTGGYTAGASYTLKIEQAVSSQTNNKSLKDAIQMPFSIKPAVIVNPTPEPAPEPTPAPTPTPTPEPSPSNPSNGTNVSQFVLGMWNTYYGGISAQVDFKSDMTLTALGFPGSYSFNGTQMTVDIINRQFIGEMTILSNSSFKITRADGQTMTFTR